MRDVLYTTRGDSLSAILSISLDVRGDVCSEMWSVLI